MAIEEEILRFQVEMEDWGRRPRVEPVHTLAGLQEDGDTLHGGEDMPLLLKEIMDRATVQELTDHPVCTWFHHDPHEERNVWVVQGGHDGNLIHELGGEVTGSTGSPTVQHLHSDFLAATVTAEDRRVATFTDGLTQRHLVSSDSRRTKGRPKLVSISNEGTMVFSEDRRKVFFFVLLLLLVRRG
jgi:hypothetical protein